VELHITRRLRPRPAPRARTPRSARDPGGPDGRAVHDHHQPAAAGEVARLRRGSDPGRCALWPAASPGPPDCA